MAGAHGILAYLAVSIVLQSTEPEADIADVAAWVEVCKWGDPSRLPIVTLQRRQPGIPTAATTAVSELTRHCMSSTPSPSIHDLAASTCADYQLIIICRRPPGIQLRAPQQVHQQLQAAVDDGLNTVTQQHSGRRSC